MIHPDPKLRISSKKLVFLLSKKQNRKDTSRIKGHPLVKNKLLSDIQKSCIPSFKKKNSKLLKISKRFQTELQNLEFAKIKTNILQNCGSNRKSELEESDSAGAFRGVSAHKLSKSWIPGVLSSSRKFNQNMFYFNFDPEISEHRRFANNACYTQSPNIKNQTNELKKWGVSTDISSTHLTNLKKVAAEPFGSFRQPA